MADMIIDDLFDDYWEYEHEPEDEYPRLFMCRYCGYQDLQWTKTERGWRLANQSGRVHTCKKYGSR